MAKIPHADEGAVCPFNQRDMSEVCHKCPMWIHVRGKHPQTGEELDDWRCSFAWMPYLMIENTLMQCQTGAAVESFRNEMVQANETVRQLAHSRTKFLGSVVPEREE